MIDRMYTRNTGAVKTRVNVIAFSSSLLRKPTVIAKLRNSIREKTNTKFSELVSISGALGISNIKKLLGCIAVPTDGVMASKYL